MEAIKKQIETIFRNAVAIEETTISGESLYKLQFTCHAFVDSDLSKVKEIAEVTSFCCFSDYQNGIKVIIYIKNETNN
jgi:hypothetical protein